MANVRITRDISPNSALGRKISKTIAIKVAQQLLAVAENAVVRANDIVREELVTDRPADRRRNPGSRHLLGSFRCDVVWSGQDFPITLRMRSLSPAVNFQESGAEPHTITGPSVFPVAKRWNGKGKPAGWNPQAYKFTAASGRGTSNVKASDIKHPGNKAHHMMRRGLEGAVEAAYHKAVVARQRR